MDSICIGITNKGTQCTRTGRTVFEGHYCATHFQKKLEDVLFRARYEAFVQAEQLAEEARQQDLRAQAFARQALLEQQRAAELANAEQRAAQRRERRIAKNNALIESAHLLSPNDIIYYVRSLMNMWDVQMFPGLELPKAYACLKFMSSTSVGFPELMRSVVRIVRQAVGHHHVHARYADVPAEEREPAFQQLQQALVAYGEITNARLLELIPVGDPFRTVTRVRVTALENQAAQAAAQAQFQHDLVHNPVVFQRDPEGGINLRAFANDNQSVHRSSVQNATHRAALAIVERPLLPGQDTLPEIIADFNLPDLVRWSNAKTRERVITELTNDYFTTEAFSLKYSDVLDHVWAYIKVHAEKKELVIRLAQEVAEGRLMCSNGKMAHLINVLQGYDETLESAKPRELFHGRISLLRDRPFAERELAAQALFTEFDIPAGEHAAWLEPLLEA